MLGTRNTEARPDFLRLPSNKSECEAWTERLEGLARPALGKRFVNSRGGGKTIRKGFQKAVAFDVGLCRILAKGS